MKKSVLICMVCAVTVAHAHAAGTACPIAGHYEGNYEGRDDHGTVSADVNGATGVVSGQARSALTGESLAIGGVVNSRGSMTTVGNVEAGAAFSGRFLSTGYASGQWAKQVNVGGALATGNGG
ncbi:hypothetical protein [Paraburkholderia caledonica]|uniref:ABC-type protease/lipase transport system fused ATPase/permease subunit n=1 Tax=Paraburkholderia caledonica TaxID=134536 RepID=A0AB73IPJ3_9BURK|nr:ABC-type protease/lipase transport system fused ATPase/permease subunit [Paraburkholderia caledonica]